MKVALIGLSGYAGKVLYQLLGGHSRVNQVNIYDHNVDEVTTVADTYKGMIGNRDRVYPYDYSEIMNKNDAAFFATPAGVTSKLAQPFIHEGFPVIDLSGDYRLTDPQTYEDWYHKPAAVSGLDEAEYGIADFNHLASTTNYVANPGCYATATLTGLKPVFNSDMFSLDSVIVDAKSGTSGACKRLTESSHFTNVNENLSVYKPNQHQHIPEIMQQLVEWNHEAKPIQFTTSLLPISRGIMATMYVKVKPDVGISEIDELFEAELADAPFTRFTGTELPDIKEVVGTNFCDVGIAYNETNQTLMIVSVIDNLIKGASGQAVQNFNQMFGFAEDEGLKLAQVTV
ncbi:N-acetyl-gamma-glutamyl-phosphate reductase [Lentilactobacillus curieae]|uniref:N-acetyl-gamma-glutamyl-phosphate reductase n=1 Tax=Lentilactobacillus curieae TaxID=1138822 RepID=A0A1S6QH01_9LACO|nr:N-acetyl-gamma-glutamyl-phosphate reductase [Lentilactobacillus curieae]AQW20885.1 N-acetyl-gamma-glutamyl-phosphate reductase [Lentilactobacillus curieae]